MLGFLDSFFSYVSVLSVFLSFSLLFWLNKWRAGRLDKFLNFLLVSFLFFLFSFLFFRLSFSAVMVFYTVELFLLVLFLLDSTDWFSKRLNAFLCGGSALFLVLLILYFFQ